MRHDGIRAGKLAALSLALALAIGGGGFPTTPSALAQDKLPSVSDYRLPSPSASPKARAQGPVDNDIPVVVTPPSAQPDQASETPPAPASKPAPKAGPSQPARAPAPQASASARPAVTASASPHPAQAPQSANPKPATPQPAAASAAIPANAGQANPAPAPSEAAVPLPGATASPFEWHVHSAADANTSGSGASWPWLAGLAFLLGAAVMLLVQQVLRRRRSAAASATDWEAPAQPAPQPSVSEATTGATAMRDVAPARPAPEPPQPPTPKELDLLSVMAQSDEPVAAPQPRSAPSTKADPLALELSARRLSATLMNTVLNYELTVSNTGPDAIGAIVVGGDMIGAHASLPSRSQLELSGNSITPLHSIASLAPGESVVLKGEFKLALTAITPIRNGNAALFIPLARFRVEALGRSSLPLVVSRTFVVGENQDRPGAALKPFRLDLGPRLYSQIGQRELALSA